MLGTNPVPRRSCMVYTLYGIHKLVTMLRRWPHVQVHHVGKRHPYRDVAKLLACAPEARRPQVCGLTASLTYAVQEGKMTKDIHSLCEDLCIRQVVSASETQLREGGFHAPHTTGDARHHDAVDMVTLNPPRGRAYEGGIVFEV